MAGEKDIECQMCLMCLSLKTKLHSIKPKKTKVKTTMTTHKLKKK